MKSRLCPILVHIPLGLLNVTTRVRILNPKELSKKYLRSFCNLHSCVIPAEIKYDSFGYLHDNLVCVDYGS